MRRIHITASKSYDVLIGEGLLDKCGELTAKVVKPCKCVIVSDDTVDELYGDRAQISFSYAGFDVTRFAFPAGEASKNMDTLGDLLKLPGDTFTFVYDLGDSWKHIVTLVDIRPNMYEDTDGDYAGAHLISGEGACPPEDVGGVDGYADMLKSLSDPKDEERESYLKWLGRDFNPEFFDLHELQNRVDDFQRVIGEARWGFYHR